MYALHKRFKCSCLNDILVAAGRVTATQVTLPEANSCLEYDVFMRHPITMVYEKPDTDMGDFWISSVEMPDPLMRFLDACYARNSNEYLSLTYSLLLD